jgi:hypothetical protein
MILTNDQINKIVEKINAKINLPVLGEKAEAIILKFAVKKVIEFLELQLPEDLKKLITDASDGISEDEANAIAERIVRYMNANIDIPLLNEDEEAAIFDIVVKLVINSMKKNINFETILNQ